MARPKKDVDAEQVRKLAAIDCSLAEIASVVNCSVDTLERRFAEVIKKGREEGCASLKRKQFEVAQSGNPTMLIWLGKQRLGQRDQVDTEHKGGITVRVLRRARAAIESPNGNGNGHKTSRLKVG